MCGYGIENTDWFNPAAGLRSTRLELSVGPFQSLYMSDGQRRPST